MRGVLHCIAVRRASSVRPQRLNNWGQMMPSTHAELLPGPDHVSPWFTKDTHRARRDRLVDVVSAATGQTDVSLLCFSAASHVTMTNDIPYRWRQHSDFLYLTGFEEGDSALLVQRHADGTRDDVLFVRPRDAAREMWDGPRTGVERVPSGFGLRSEDIASLVPLLTSGGLRPRSGIVMGTSNMSPYHPSARAALRGLAESGLKVSETDACEVLRLRKEPAEIDLMRVAAGVTRDAFAHVFRFCAPGVPERQIDALLEYASVLGGAQRLAYPPVVAGGVSANTLHYVANHHLLQDGELVLIDAGCELFSYASDVTRTFPVNGRFTKPQAELYEAVLTANEHCIDLCRSGVSLQHVHRGAMAILALQLVRLGFASTPEELVSSGRLRRYFPHSIGHYLGMDVHDTQSVPTSTVLAPSMVVTVEPGLYIPHDDTSVPEQYRGIGIRIEDNVVITNGAPSVLTSDIPKSIAALETACERRD